MITDYTSIASTIISDIITIIISDITGKITRRRPSSSVITGVTVIKLKK